MWVLKAYQAAIQEKRRNTLRKKGSSMTVLYVLLAAGVTGGVCFFIGRLSSKINVVERLIEGHYTTIKGTVARLEEDGKGMRSEITGLREDINALIQEIRASRPKEQSDE